MTKLFSCAVLPRALKISGVVLSLACVGAAPIAHAQDAPPPPPPQGGAPAPQDGAPRGEGRPRGEGGPRDGGPRGEGGQRGGGGPRGGGEGGPPADETPEQRQQRMLQPYTNIVEDLTDDQKTRILAIVDAASAELRTIREDETYDDDMRREAMSDVRAEIPTKVMAVLTPAQAAVYKAALEEQAKALAELAKIRPLRPDEDVEQMRTRVLKGYEDALEEMSVKQKTQIIKILEASGEVMDGIIADNAQTPAQKRAALDKESQAVGTKVFPLLDADQRKVWQKAHEAKLKAWQQEAAGTATMPLANLAPANPAPK